MDVLSGLMDGLKVRSGDGYLARLRAPWGIDFPQRQSQAPFYVVERGAAIAEVANQQVFMSAGDMVVLLDGSAHSLSDSVSSPRVPFWSLSYELDEPEPSLLIRHGGEGPETLVMAGAIVFDGWQIGPWLKNLPKLIHIQADSPAIQHSITPIRSMLVRERRSTEPGARTAEAELVKLLFLNILRFAITQTTAEHKGCPRSPVALMFDAQLRALVEAVHENPGDPWSVVQMASKAGMSRTKFIERFTQVAGESPASYLTRLRMTKAVDLLETSDATLEQIAERVGYGSEAAFGSAFKRKLGVAPGVYRRRQRSEPMPVLDV